MSRMADLFLEIETLLEEGWSVPAVAAKLNIPIHWVEDVLETMPREGDEELS